MEGNARFEGYSLDLIDAVAKNVGFKYRFELAPDGKYGGYNKVTKKWDGLIKQLLERVIKALFVPTKFFNFTVSDTENKTSKRWKTHGPPPNFLRFLILFFYLTPGFCIKSF